MGAAKLKDLLDPTPRGKLVKKAPCCRTSQRLKRELANLFLDVFGDHARLLISQPRFSATGA
jgi:hypothetical protein